MSKPLVSVIIPARNSRKTLQYTLESALAQTYDRVEIILVDDGSTDNCTDVASQLSSNIRIIRIDHQGAPAARNIGLSESSGEYIQFLDSDDLLAKDKISLQVEQLLFYNELCLSFCLWSYFGESCKGSERNTSRPKEYSSFTHSSRPWQLLANLWVNGDFIPTLCWLAPRQLVLRTGFWKEDLTADQDGDYFGRMLFNSTTVACIPKVKAYYRKPGISNISSACNTQSAESRLKVALGLVEQMTVVSKSYFARKACFIRLSQACYQASPFRLGLMESAYSASRRLMVRPLHLREPYLYSLLVLLFGLRVGLHIRAFATQLIRGLPKAKEEFC